MRVEYPDVDLFWADAINACWQHGYNNSYNKELIGISFTLTDITKNFVCNKALDIDASRVARVALECIMHNSKDISKAADLLEDDGSTYYINYGGDGLQFMNRGGCLYAVFSSTEPACMFKSLPSLIYVFTTIHKILADCLGLRYGYFTLNSNMIYIHGSDYDKISKDFQVEQHIDYGEYERPLPEAAEVVYNYDITTGVFDLAKACIESSECAGDTYINDLGWCALHGNCEYGGTIDHKHRVVSGALSSKLKDLS